MLNGALEDCTEAAQGSGTVNNDIACAKGIIERASDFDPTGVLTIAGAFLQPYCGVKPSDYGSIDLSSIEAEPIATTESSSTADDSSSTVDNGSSTTGDGSSTNSGYD